MSDAEIILSFIFICAICWMIYWVGYFDALEKYEWCNRHGRYRKRKRLS